MHGPVSFLPAISAGLRHVQDRMSLRQQVGVATSILSFLIVAAVAMGAAVVGERAVRAESESKMSEIAFSVADRLDRGIAARLRTVELLAQIETLKATWVGDPESGRRILDQALRAIPHAAWLAFATSDGIVRAASGGLLEGQSLASEPWFQTRIAGGRIADVYAFEPLASLLSGTVDGTQRRFLGLTARVEDSLGRMLGVLAVLVDWKSWTGDSVSVVLGRREVTANTGIWILANDGTPLLGSSFESGPITPEEFAQTHSAFRGAFTSGGPNGQYVNGFARTTGQLGFGWTVVSRQRESLGFGIADSIVWTIVAIGVIVGALGLLAAILFAGRVSRPIRNLADKADRLGRDDTDMLPRMRGSREVVQLSTALRSLILRLGSAEDERHEAESRAAEEARKLSSDIETLRAMADTDGLTRLLNRRGFMAFAADAMDHYNRSTNDFAILMIDLDRFKSINDTYGHAAGDTVLRHVASIIAMSVRPSDKVGRFGGEEFIVLLGAVTGEAAESTAERIRQAVAGSPVLVDLDSIVGVTLSIGLATARAGDRDVQDVIERADLALYAAKNSGRNTVSTAPVRAVTPLRKAG